MSLLDVAKFLRVSGKFSSASLMQNTNSFEKVQYSAQLLYYPAAYLTKASILFLIARVFSPRRRAVFLARLLIVAMALYYIPAFFIKAFRCNPVHLTWEPWIKGHCFTTEYRILLADGIASLVTDILILILPVPLIWQLQASWKSKIKIMLVFAGGILLVGHNATETALTI